MVDLVGFEPTTLCVQSRCSPIWSYRPIGRTFYFPLGNKLFGLTAASLNLYHFYLLGSLHAVHPGFAPGSTGYKAVALPLMLMENSAIEIRTPTSPVKIGVTCLLVDSENGDLYRT